MRFCLKHRFCLKNTHIDRLFVAVFTIIGLVSCGSGVHDNSLNGTPQEPAVRVLSPANNSTVGTAVNYVASASTGCASGISSIGILTAPGVVAYTIKSATLNTNLKLNPGTYNTTVEAWDNCGGSTAMPVRITVSAGAPGSGGSAGTTPRNSFSNLHEKGGWTGYVLLPPSYLICSSCSVNGPQTTLSMKQGVTTPSLSGNAT